jgi:catechol 2,3-dioxygenase-like lactoylglutathione lyase family enzyme
MASENLRQQGAVHPFDAQITFCYTADLAGSARFYEDLLNLPLALDQGACRIYRVAEAAYLGMCTRDEAPRPDGIILTLVTEDVDAAYQRLAARGVVFDKPPQANPQFRIYHCLLRDPNGYLIEIQRFDDPRWRRPTGG